MAVKKSSSPKKKKRSRLNNSIKRFRSRLSSSVRTFKRHNQEWQHDSAEYAELANKIGYIDLFRYALWREKLALLFGFLFMWYAASWQPISVFILAIMATLMGHFHKQTQLLDQLDGMPAINNNDHEINATTTTLITTSSINGTNNNNGDDYDYDSDEDANQNDTVIMRVLQSTFQTLFQRFNHQLDHHLNNFSSNGDSLNRHHNELMLTTQTAISPLINQTNHHHHHHLLKDMLSDLLEIKSNNETTVINDKPALDADSLEIYNTFPLLAPVSAFITPMFDSKPPKDIRDAVEDVVTHESELFLRRSFEINGAAFLLALTQLCAFCIGLKLITWSAKKQASRIKLLYFRSCLHQEVTWFESIDSASGSASSLNALVDKFEDGIGTKLALLSYFLGHVALFALTAFYQMFSLSLFCMSFVLAIGLMIMFVSEIQATAMGQQALFTKRSLQLAEEILSAIRTVFAFNGQHKELQRFDTSLKPAYNKSLMKHLFTALDTALSKFSIFACFGAYCFYAMHLFPPYSDIALNKSTVLAVMRGAEVSIVNILISIPFMEALQQAKGSIARIYAAIERRSKIDPSSTSGCKPGDDFLPSIRFHQVSFEYLERSPTRRRSTLPYLNLPQTIIPMSEINAFDQQQQQQQQQQHQQQDQQQANTNSRSQSISVGPLVAGRKRLSVLKRGSKFGAAGFHNGTQTMALGPPVQSSLILNNFSLQIEPGKSVALVGTSGSGKSTILSLVQRLYDIRSGAIFIGQSNIVELNVGWLRSQIGVVNQEPRLFDMTIEENIRLGMVLPVSQQQLADSTTIDINKIDINKLQQRQMDNNNDITTAASAEQVIEAARCANAHDFIQRLPQGYNTKVGTGGVQLSGGQKQRIAIARALIRKPKILLLDESTSALDSESETIVQEALEQASKGRTTLIVAHRLSTVKNVDKIVVMDRGRVLEMGKHDELMQLNDGLYRRMYEQQLNQANKGHGKLVGYNQRNRPLNQLKSSDSGQLKGASVGEQAVGDKTLATTTITSTTTVTSTKTSGAGDKENKQQQQQQQQQQQETCACNDSGEQVDTSCCCCCDTSDNNVVKRRQQDSNNCGEQVEHKQQQHCCSSCQASECCHCQTTQDETAEEDDDDEDDDEEEDDDDEEDEYEEEEEDEEEEDDDDRRLTKDDRKPLSLIALLKFIQVPKISGVCALIACFLAGLILPMNLIAHSYLFSAFAYSELDQIGEHLYLFGVAILSMSSFVLIISFLQVTLPGYVGEKISTRMRLTTMKSLLEKPIFYYDMDSNSAGALCSKFNAYITDIQSIAGTRVATILEAVSTLMAGAIFGFGQNLKLSMFCLSFAVIVLVTTIIESRIFQREVALQQKYDAQLAHLMADALSNIKTIASLHQEHYFALKFKQIIREREHGVGSWTAWLRTFLTSLKFVMPAMSWSASMYYGCHLLVNKQIDLQTIFIVCPVVLFAVNDTFRALVFLPELLKARKSIEKLYRLNREYSPEVMQTLTLERQQMHSQQQQQQVIGKAGVNQMIGMVKIDEQQQQQTEQGATEAPPKGRSITFHPDLAQQTNHAKRNSSLMSNGNFSQNRRKSRLNSLVPKVESRGRIDFKDVTFSYPMRPGALVLDGLTMSVAPGESVAIVGASGSGKSTCVGLLEKFYDYHCGRLSIDGYDLRFVAQDWVRSQIGLVSQEPTLLSYTIGDNIRYGDNSRYVSKDEIIRAAKTANIHDFIMTLPDEYDTELSNSTYSSQLSGGQKQRIAIARALVRNAPILIFDEATSALDSTNETTVQDALDKARFGKTQLIIAHRLATIKNVDRIIVMRSGKVVEEGTHQQLMSSSSLGHYRRLYERQARQS